MGSIESKSPRAAAQPGKGQENGHVSSNGDLAKADGGDAVPAVDNGSVEVAADAKPEEGAGDAIEPAPEAGEAEATKDVTKKKKRFSFKKPFKLAGISFRRVKKESPKAEVAAADGKVEAATEEVKAADEPSAAPEQGRDEPGAAPEQGKDELNAAPEQGNDESSAAPEQGKELNATPEQGKDEPNAAPQQGKEETAQPAAENQQSPQTEPTKAEKPEQPEAPQGQEAAAEAT